MHADGVTVAVVSGSSGQAAIPALADLLSSFNVDNVLWTAIAAPAGLSKGMPPAAGPCMELTYTLCILSLLASPQASAADAVVWRGSSR